MPGHPELRAGVAVATKVGQRLSREGHILEASKLWPVGE